MPIVIGDGVGEPGGTLAFCAIWFNLAANPADLCSFRKADEKIGITIDTRTEVRQLANRRRIVRRGVAAYTSIDLSLPHCEPAQIEWLRDHAGQLVCVRDHVGTKVYVVYAQLPREVLTRVRDWADVKLSLDEITHTEAV
ncbi:hypothetical protein NPS01_25570 [Nocardioides psychrotolerans]|uniref:Uncharacterized protein n=1 Tax=Nocardioides psychrotolerans TaxID=1005945 RepID=A0A1I3LR44_9ACTN|nr:hypothetical protein [Nocardioides psychrotolerans]GEP38894.1 hypothetical protein NPS01_25570 [Nocardioides psychrotolerans]SFI87172.1 hypothetical protein SAMN05216561_11462 [Nocardioides psychrotolerans]